MPASGTVNFMIEVGAASNDAKEVNDSTRELLSELRALRIGSAYPAPAKRALQTVESADPLRLGTLKVAVEPIALPRLLEFVHRWAMHNAERIVRLRLQYKAGDAATGLAGPARYRTFTIRGRAGQVEDVDYLMATLAAEDDIATAKLVDFALGLVSTAKGKERIRHFLFEGTLRQRNYAALFFKRLGVREVLEEAVRRERVSAEQAFSE